MITRPSLRPLALAAALVVPTALLGGCDPPPAEDLILGAQPVEEFAVERVTPNRGALAADAPLVVRFTQDLDPSTIGSRSVRVTRADGRHPLRVRAWGMGRELLIAPLPGRMFPVGESLVLHVDGAPSPRAVRSASGEALVRRSDTPFRVGPPSTDLRGPRLVGSAPANGAADVAPGSNVELRFNEPIARGAVVSGDAVTLRVDGVEVGARLELSGSSTLLVVRPVAPLPPDRRVELALHGCLLDVAGNPLERGSMRSIAFRTRATSLHELSEDFVDSANADANATSCGWDDAETPGVLVARAGSVRVAPGSGRPPLAIGDGSTHLHFQILVPADDVPAGLASALHVEFVDAPPGARVVGALVEAGPSSLEVCEPSFLANRNSAELRTVARVTDPIEIDPASGASGLASIDIAFEEPLRLVRGESVLLDVRLDVTAGVRVAAFADSGASALVEGAGELVPAVSLVVSPSTPQARSNWYDTGVTFPGWRPCSVTMASESPGVIVIAEFQSAPPGADGTVDSSRSSPWESDLSRLPAFRFVRFRLRFDGSAEGGAAARIDRIVLAYER